jgi:hypothetical protein
MPKTAAGVGHDTIATLFRLSPCPFEHMITSASSLEPSPPKELTNVARNRRRGHHLPRLRPPCFVPAVSCPLCSRSSPARRTFQRAYTHPAMGAAGEPARARRPEWRLERGGAGGRSGGWSGRSDGWSGEARAAEAAAGAGRRGRLERPEQQLERGGAGSRRCGAWAAGDVGHGRPAMWARATGDVGHARPAKGGFLFFIYFSGEY